MMNLRVASFGRLRGLTLPYLALAAASLLALAGAGAVIEMVYHLQMDAAMGGEMKYLGLALDAKATGTWAGCAGGAVGGRCAVRSRTQALCAPLGRCAGTDRSRDPAPRQGVA
jgi:hypothetical protein